MSTNLNIVLDLARARTLVLRDIDHPLGSHHGLGLNDLAVLLERIGLVGRESNPTDARLALVVLTPRGAEVAAEAGATAEEAAERALGRLWSREETETLGKLLGRAAADATID